MARFKLPESMKAWKVVSSLPDNNGNSVYEVSRKETDGSVTNAVMMHFRATTITATMFSS